MVSKSTAVHGAVAAVGASVTGFFLTAPDAAMQVWQSIPSELVKAVIPEPYVPVVSGVITLLVAISGVVKRNKSGKKHG